MHSRELLLIATLAIVACVSAAAHAQTFGFGRTPTEAELKAVFPSAAPDGSGLPAGRGRARSWQRGSMSEASDVAGDS